MKAIIVKMVFFLYLLGYDSYAGQIQISFLDDAPAINSAAALLLAKGCAKNAVESFVRVANWYNATPSDLDLRKFPQKTNGFYSFQSVTSLVSAIDRPLIYTSHQPELNCFDFTFLLSDSFIKFSITPEAIAGPFLMPRTMTNGDVVLTVAATPENAFKLVCPAWWAETAKDIFDGASQSNRMCFMAAFDTFTVLPTETGRNNLPAVLLKSLQSSWSRCGVSFSRGPQIVIFHSVALKSHNSLSTHSGLLFKDGRQYLYFEKAGVNGPYVMLKLLSISDLFIWYLGAIKPVTDKGNIIFATFNDRSIYPVN